MSTPQSPQLWISERRLCLDESGGVVEGTSPDRVSLLVGEGCALAYDRAVELGLVDEADGVSRETDSLNNEPRDEGTSSGDTSDAPTAGAEGALRGPEREGEADTAAR